MVIKAQIDIWGAMRAEQTATKKKAPDLKHAMVPCVAANDYLPKKEKEKESE